MKKQQKQAVLISALTVLIMAGGSGPVQATLVANGNFESPGGGSAVRYTTSQTLPNWTVSGSAAYQVQGDNTDPLNHYMRLQSQYQVPSGAATITQTFDTSAAFAIGHPLAVSFDLAAFATGGTITWSLTVNIGSDTHVYHIDETGTTGVTLTPWTPETFVYMPTGNSTTLSFTGEYVTNDQTYGTSLDNVDVEIIPEPATLMLLLIGGGLMVYRRRLAC